MQTTLLVIHLLITVAMIAVILIQRSEGGGLGMGSSTMGGMMSARGTANLLTRMTGILAAGFMATSLGLAILASHTSNSLSILDKIEAPVAAPVETPAAPAEAPAAPAQ